jgi:hypothetical protein
MYSEIKKLIKYWMFQFTITLILKEQRLKIVMYSNLPIFCYNFT